MACDFSILRCIETKANNIIEEKAETLRALPVYTETATYAWEHGEEALYRESMQANVLCRTAIEDAISMHYHDNHLHIEGAKSVLEKFGAERTCYVLAATVQDKDWDARISDKNKAWAKGFCVTQETTAWNSPAYRRFIISGSHPGLIDLFVNQVRRELEQLAEHKPSVLSKLKEEYSNQSRSSSKAQRKENSR